jgi:hypothetical protein
MDYERFFARRLDGLKAEGLAARGFPLRRQKFSLLLRSGVPSGIRTPVTAVRDRCPRSPDDEDEKARPSTPPSPTWRGCAADRRRCRE